MGELSVILPQERHGYFSVALVACWSGCVSVRTHHPLTFPSLSRHHLSCDDCLEDKSKDY